eukprot:TRINITY_DN16462_c0_g2_i4.p2 TRINITY_DN16462_c0_g2~~TRINITY_DN16462_c0_g2_i4.p2  ORF type:complete len:523 (+),score=205.76 TRINITY_DN16462_c0_g2_i4:1033-2601(+)
MFKKYAPGKVAQADVLLTKHAGKEEALIASLVKKFGPEPPPPAAAGGAAAPAPMTHRDRVVALFQTYSPDKVGSVDALLTKHAGKEAALIQALVKKFGPEPPPPAAATGAAAPRTHEERVRAMYEKYLPAKISTVSALLAKHAGKEAALIAALVKKLGPEPPAAGGGGGEALEPGARGEQQAAENAEWAPLPAEQRISFEAQRRGRWDVEDEWEQDWAALEESAAKQHARAQKAEKAGAFLRGTVQRTLMRGRYEAWMKRLKESIREQKRRHQAILDERMSIYDQLQTNKFSMYYYEQQSRRREKEKERTKARISKAGPPPLTATSRPRNRAKDFVSVNVREASMSPSQRRSQQRQRSASPSRRGGSAVQHYQQMSADQLTPAALKKILRYQNKWLPKHFQSTDYPSAPPDVHVDALRLADLAAPPGEQPHTAGDHHHHLSSPNRGSRSPYPQQGLFGDRSQPTPGYDRERERPGSDYSGDAAPGVADSLMLAQTLQRLTGTEETGLERAIRELQRQRTERA